MREEEDRDPDQERRCVQQTVSERLYTAKPQDREESADHEQREQSRAAVDDHLSVFPERIELPEIRAAERQLRIALHLFLIEQERLSKSRSADIRGQERREHRKRHIYRRGQPQSALQDQIDQERREEKRLQLVREREPEHDEDRAAFSAQCKIQ